MTLVNLGGDRDVRHGEYRKDEGLDQSDEDADCHPERSRYQRTPEREQEDQRQQKLAHEDVEVEPEGEGHNLCQLVDHRQRKERRLEQQVLEITAEAALLDAVELDERERHQGKPERRVPVVGRGPQAWKQPQEVRDQEEREQTDGQRDERDAPAFEGALRQVTQVLKERLRGVLERAGNARMKLAPKDCREGNQQSANDQGISDGVDVELDARHRSSRMSHVDLEPCREQAHDGAALYGVMARQPATAAVIGNRPYPMTAPTG